MAGAVSFATLAGAAAAALPPLRDELELSPGPAAADGQPTWTLHDPASGRWYRLGWLEIEVLTRWAMGAAARIAAAIGAETTLRPDAGDVEAVQKFVMHVGLTRAAGAEATARFVTEAKARRHGAVTWLLHNYLFLRLPLVRPDRWLDRVVPHLGVLWTRGFWLLIVAIAIAGGALVLRRFDEFTSGFSFAVTTEGAIATALCLGTSKLVHELGHATTAKRFGCRVPTMGVALMVLWPVLYTDTSAAHRLVPRRARVTIGAAGMAAELALASIATLVWSFLPEGPLRSGAFLLATSAWVMTLAVNLNPLMRFDGYYLLADLLDEPNLQPRSFALARWRLREALFGFGDAPPERLAPKRRSLLIVYAYAIWIYRFFLFLGIAVLVYQHVFKLLGIFLMGVEIVWFIALPIVREMRAWAKRRDDIAARGQLWRPALLAALVVAVLVVPWRGSVEGVAWLRAAEQSTVYAPRGAQLVDLRASEGAAVHAGDVLVQLASPELERERIRLEAEARSLSEQAEGGSTSTKLIQRNDSLWNQLRSTMAGLDGVREQLAQLRIVAATDGVTVDLAEDLQPGAWIATGEPLLVVRSAERATIEAYVDESELSRIRTGADARFVPSGGGEMVTAKVASIDTAAMRVLQRTELASDLGGPLPTRRLDNGDYVPVASTYRVLLTVDAGQGAPRTARGEIRIDAAPRALIERFWRSAVAVLVRESGF